MTILQLGEMFANVIVPQKFFVAGETSRIAASWETQIILKGEIVALGQKIVLDVVLDIWYFLSLVFSIGNGIIKRTGLSFLFSDVGGFLKRYENDFFNLVDGMPLYFADIFAELDEQKEVFAQNGEDAHHNWASYYIIGVRRMVLVQF